jgi:hypothetical protein
MSKVMGVQTETISGLHFGSPGKKSHLNANEVESCRWWWLPPSPGCGESSEFKVVYGLF